MTELHYPIKDAKQDSSELEALWQSLFKAERDSFFVSWPWVKCWLQELPDSSRVGVLVADLGGHKLAAIVGRPMRGLFSLEEGLIGETGFIEYDDLVVERNHILGDLSSIQSKLLVSTILERSNLNRLIFRCVQESYLNELLNKLEVGACKFEVSSRPSYYVELDKVREAPYGYLSLISSNKRRQIRRSLKLYEEAGQVFVSEPKDAISAMEMFDEMIALHQREWRKRGEPGCFDNDFVSRFHRRLIRENFGSTNIRLFRVSSEEQTIGIVYGFISGEDFLYYQSGFKYLEDNRYKPGLICHSLLIEALAKEGLKKYDFLAGEAPYKKSLSTDSYEMCNLEIYDDSIKSSLYLMSRSVKRAVKGLYSC